MTCERSHTAAFTGHRTYRGEAAEALASLLGDLHAEGYRRFLCGMALGFDMAAAEAVLALRAAHPEVRLVCVVPFAGQDRRFPAVEQERYRRILEAADETVVLRDDYRPDCYARRNDRLTDGASAVVAWYDGSSGGTHYTVRRARRLGLRVLNLWQNPQAEFPGF
ncbi:SLOG family protein [uncultured Alistipes sp.]|uniref:SLOG family protein n=1 Tax=uncultured Alistipes sp. TaxID=538949 RepID=UPI002615C3DA|nr:SLOG family protein [uncultured Alistipes sp.]